MRRRVEVRVGLKPGMLDPQGEAVAHALAAMGYAGVADVRIGKWITFAIDAEGADEAAVEAAVDEMCRRLLANPVVERYAFEIADDADDPDATPGPEADA